MKRRTLWKVCASVLLVTVLLPIFSALNPTTVGAVTTAPLPYAMETFGQSHGQIYLTAAPTIDGTKDSTYHSVASFDQQSNTLNGIFISSTADGTNPTSGLASEFLPVSLEVSATYTADAVYFYVESAAREAASLTYALNAGISFNFGASQTDAFSNANTISLSTASLTGEGYKVSSVANGTSSDSDGTYNLVKNTYEFKLSLAELPTGADRIYFTLSYEFSTGTDTMYWVLGTPNNVTLPGETKPIKISEAFLTEYKAVGAYTPAVLEMMGAKSASENTARPSVAVTRSDSNTTFDRTFVANLSLTGVQASKVKEAGILFAADASTVGNKNLVWSSSNTYKTTSGIGTDTLNYSIEFSTTEENYNKFFAIRPYIVYTDDHIEYGNYYSNSAYYFDTANVGYTQEMKVLMLGSSFCSYYLDELVQIAAADGIHMTAARVYKSGGRVFEHWQWLTNDFKQTGDKTSSSDSVRADVFTYRVHTPEKPSGVTTQPISSKECLAKEDWDHISIQDYIDTARSKNLTSCFKEVFPYVTNLKNYLAANHPNAELYWNETWGFQVGWGYTASTIVLDENGNVASGEATKTDPCDTVAEQRQMYLANQILADYVCKNVGLLKIPSGSAWEIARDNPIVGDTLCMAAGKGGGLGDYYHDGDTGGGQYINACVWYEILTGNSCVGNTWVPTEYELAAEKIPVLQQAAHEAVQAARAAGLTKALSDY